MGYALRAGLSYCIANGRTAFLDTITDRYFCLPRPLDERFQAYLKSAPDNAPPEDLLHAFKSQRLLMETDATDLRVRYAQVKTPAREVLQLITRRPSPPVVIEAAVDRLRAIHSVKHRPLHQILQTCRHRAECAKTRLLPEGSERVVSDLHAFRVSARLASSFNQCLSSSIALTQFLGRRRLYPNLVLGVRMAPFAAHAWVQSDDLLLNDTVDMASRYTPILVI